MQWYIKAIKNYVNFDGRARRKEYWMFYLFNLVFEAILYIILFTVALGEASAYGTAGFATILYVIMILYGLFITLPSLAVAVRRLHDQGKSGAWWFISFVPFIGGIWFLVLMCMDGTYGPNQYGEDPK